MRWGKGAPKEDARLEYPRGGLTFLTPTTILLTITITIIITITVPVTVTVKAYFPASTFLAAALADPLVQGTKLRDGGGGLDFSALVERAAAVFGRESVAIIDLAALERRGLDKVEVLLTDIMGLPSRALEPHRNLIYTRVNTITSASMPRMGELRTMFERWSATAQPDLEPSTIACLCVPVAMGTPDSGAIPLNCTAGETLLHNRQSATAMLDEQFMTKYKQQIVQVADGGSGVRMGPSPLCDIDYDALLANPAWVSLFEKEAARLLASTPAGATGEVNCPPCYLHGGATTAMMKNAPMGSFHGHERWASAGCLDEDL